MARRGRGGTPYWVAIRLVEWLADPGNWNDLDGYLTLRGACLDDLDARRALNAAYACLIANKDAKERRAFDAALEAVPQGDRLGSMPRSKRPDAANAEIANMMHAMRAAGASVV